MHRVTEARPIFIYNIEPPEMAGSVSLQALIPARHIGAKALYFGRDMDPEPFLDRHEPKILIITKMYKDAPLKLAEVADSSIVGGSPTLNVTFTEAGTIEVASDAMITIAE